MRCYLLSPCYLTKCSRKKTNIGVPGFILFFLIQLFFFTGAFAAPSHKHYRLLIMNSQTGEPYNSTRVAMLDSLAQSGYIEGKNLTIVSHSIGNDRNLGHEILKKELGKAYDVVFVNGTLMTLAAKESAFGTGLQPFVFACVTDPVGIGVINSFDEPPPANFTGVSYPVPVDQRLDFVRKLLPQVKRIGLVYADMPQSHSYRSWLEEQLSENPDFKDLQILYRSVPLETGEAGSLHMAKNAETFIRELDPQVDLFISPNDQMGVRAPYAVRVFQIATRPLIGIGRKDVTEGWGASASIYPSLQSAGYQAAEMIRRLFEGESIERIHSEWTAEFGYAFDLHKARRFGLQIPGEWLNKARGNVVR